GDESGNPGEKGRGDQAGLQGGVQEPGAKNGLLHGPADSAGHPGNCVLPDSGLADQQLPPESARPAGGRVGRSAELHLPVPGQPLPGGVRKHRGLYRGERGPGVRDRAGYSPGHKPGVSGSGVGAGRDLGALGVPHSRLGGHVAANVPGSGRDNQLHRCRPGPHRPADTHRQRDGHDRGDHLGRLEDDPLHGAAPAGWAADHSRRRLRGCQGRRRQQGSTVLPHNAAALGAVHPGRAPLQDARLLARLRPVLGDERQAVGVALDLHVQGGARQPALVPRGERGSGDHVPDRVRDRAVLYQGSRHEDFNGGV
ncbi:MAG: Maltodextrin ABC transporter, permease protein MdxF, partial [uncultured Rubrobacteraceae bacterium]